MPTTKRKHRKPAHPRAADALVLRGAFLAAAWALYLALDGDDADAMDACEAALQDAGDRLAESGLAAVS